MPDLSQETIARHTFNALRTKKGLIETYDLYRFPNSHDPNPSQPQPIAVGIIKIGNLLDGPIGFVHGGIVALLMDDMIGFATVPLQPWSVTSELAVQYKAPQPNQQYVVIRVYIDEEKAYKSTKKKRLFLKATCKSLGSSTIETAPYDQGDDGTLYSTAAATMVQVQSTSRPISSGPWRDRPKNDSSSSNQTERKMRTPSHFKGIDRPDVGKLSHDIFASQNLNINLINHAVAGTLRNKKGLIEVYNLHQFPKSHDPTASLSQPIAVAIIRVGDQLDGPIGYVHGGIVALLMDDVIGFATVPLQPWSVTSELAVQYKAPQPNQQYVVIRVFIDEEKAAFYKRENAVGTRKKRLFLKATCKSLGSSTIEAVPYNQGDDGTLYSTATATMVQVQSTGRPASAAPGRDGWQNDGPCIKARL
jgi:acyl-coenzyme A thioesterase PaaI-like protein